MGSQIQWKSKTTWTCVAAVAYGLYLAFTTKGASGIPEILGGLGGIFMRGAVGA